MFVDLVFSLLAFLFLQLAIPLFGLVVLINQCGVIYLFRLVRVFAGQGDDYLVDLTGEGEANKASAIVVSLIRFIYCFLPFIFAVASTGRGARIGYWSVRSCRLFRPH